MEDLIKYLLKYAFDHGISCALIRREQAYQSVALPDKKLIVINQNSKNKFELPFIIGHEIGHIMNGNVNGAFYCGKPVNSEERLADLYSLNLIYGYASNQFDTFEEPIQFIQQYGIPDRMLDDAYRLFKKNDDLVF
ncbi:hypothetical protein NX781_04240 [Lactobacillus kullabergensis]|uniref:hypothetical protein n=1 Tax=Lactobacillus kullabergensis TaxID=1218493 RepID=UPI0022463514|nr:hypothetical protein [Lactobacillus kullabergensis]MCX0291014.1 hypothetical protein [Lactobacillus kullabergensis]